MADTCWEDRENTTRITRTWRDVDHHGFDPEWGAVSRYQVYCASMRRRDRVIAKGRTWEEAQTLAENLNVKVRRKTFGGRIYCVRLESPASYSEFCNQRRARHNVA